MSTATKADLGQFLTPTPVADLMASMAEQLPPVLRILDPGAGAGSLLSAVVHMALKCRKPPKEIHVTAYEVDRIILPQLRATIARCRTACERQGVCFIAQVIDLDFLADVAAQLDAPLLGKSEPVDQFDLAILNPPYFKINTASHTRRVIERIGVGTTNIYTGFLAATAKVLKPGGQMIAITPRSFCNGPYFKRFRQWFLNEVTLTRIHSFHSRQEAFRDDAVLQETMILRAVRNAKPCRVTISSSTGPSDDITQRTVAYDEIVKPTDPECFIRIPTNDLADQVTEKMTHCRATLSDLELSVSTGRVVDFRVKELLRRLPARNIAPLIWATHFQDGYVAWPKNGVTKKPEGILKEAPNQLVPNEPYVLVRRFSAKEERRRVVAAIYDPKRQDCETVGFENHLNYFHSAGRGLEMQIAKGLAAFLNSTVLDQYFRLFSGHTQVNATDLRNLHYPSRTQLVLIGRRIRDKFPDQATVDDILDREVYR